MTEADITPNHQYCFGKAYEYMNIDDNTADVLDLSSMELSVSSSTAGPLHSGRFCVRAYRHATTTFFIDPSEG